MSTVSDKQGGPSPHNQRRTRWKDYIYQLIGAELSTTARYYDALIQYLPLEDDHGYLLDHIVCPSRSRVEIPDELPDLSTEFERRSLLLLNGNLNYSSDLPAMLRTIKGKLARTSRLAIVIYNPYFSWVYKLANILGLRKGALPEVFVTTSDLENICKLSGYEIIRFRLAGYFPFRLFGLGTLVNRLMPGVPLFRWLGYAYLAILRPIIPDTKKPSLSIIIPARNESGNIENALQRIPDLDGARIEVIFVEGNSTDDTWSEIQRTLPIYSDRLSISAYRQPGKGKNDAVRVGFDRANGDLVTILDADLTMPPEMLTWFYGSYCEGLGDFVNGNRMLYRMEGNAMRFLNTLGNRFFAKSLSHILGLSIGDALCGTKMFARHDYKRIVAWRNDFGDFDPFGDFELLFSASELSLGFIEVPIRYRARTYGFTNISRFRDGWTLLKMTLTGLIRVRMGKSLNSPE